MARLDKLIERLEAQQIIGDTRIEVSGVVTDSRQIRSNSVFIARRGVQIDAHQFIPNAIEKGATAIIAEEWEDTVAGVVYIKVANSMIAAGIVAAAAYGYPSESMSMCGVTGTNGKTTVATLGYRLMKQLGYKAGLFSTVENRIDGKKVDSTHTTPDILQLNRLLAEMRDDGCSHVFMEVSSHALDQDRIAGVQLDVAVFTNISREHLDYHGDLKTYINAKKKLFDQLPKEGKALVNMDDKHWKYLLQNCKAAKYTYGLRTIADYKGKILENTIHGLKMRVNEMEADFNLVGSYNASNLLAVTGAAHLMGEDLNEILIALSRIQAPEGRFDRVMGPSGKVTGVVDYAHTPDAFEKVLNTIRELDFGGGKIITVFGCGGGKDKGKRPMMGEVASRLSDVVILTADNPRDEELKEIFGDIEDGVKEMNREKIWKFDERSEAIRFACRIAKEGDLIFLAGKGHENFQEIKGKKFPWYDKEELRKNLT